MNDPMPATLGELFAANARHKGQRPAFVGGEQTLTHAQFFHRCQSLAAGLHEAGIRSGDRIGLLAHNGLPFAELLGASALLGAVVSAINWRLSAAEVAQVLENDRPVLLFASEALWPLLLDLPEPGVRRVCLDARLPGVPHIDELRIEGRPPAVPVTADAAAVFIHTAWTDGRPKAAVLTHGNLLAGAKQLRDAWRLTQGDTHLCALPLFHITALTLAFATSLAGGCSVLQAKFEPPQALDAIARHQVTLFGEFGPMLETLMQQPDAPSRLASVHHVCGLDMPDTIRRFEALCPQATFWVGYGQSEAGGMVTMGPFRDAEGSMGAALPSFAMEIIEGEICLRGPTVFGGYWERPQDSAWTLRDGWLHTGDAGRIDDRGRLFYTGRLPAKELIKSGGENVYPAEVEKVLREHPDVSDAVVIGVADAKWGESVRAVCVVRNGVTQQALIDYVGERIAHYKRPRSVVFAPSLPFKADGTHDREQIKALFGA